VSRKVTLTLTLPQARHLYTLATEGAEGILNDQESARSAIGNTRAQNAAREALQELNRAIGRASSAGKPE
jgi:hypothetical protein